MCVYEETKSFEKKNGWYINSTIKKQGIINGGGGWGNAG